MKLSRQNILFFTRTMKLGGTENVILQLCEIFNLEVNKIIVCSCGGVNVQKLEQMGIKHYQIPDIENKNPKTMFTVLRTVNRIIKENNITVIHTHHRMAAFYTSLLRCLNKFIFINTSHNTFTDKRLLTRFSLKKANLIACGEIVKKNLTDIYSLPEAQITVIRNAVKPFDGKVHPIEILEKYKKNGYFLVGNVGRLSEQKGMEYYIKAVPDVLKQCPNTKFFIIGDGQDRKKLEDVVKRLNLKNDVIFLGYHSDIQSIMSQLDLIVLSSLWEGLPLTPIEAFSVGKTVVATSVDGTVEIVDDGVNGTLIEPKESRQIADEIIKMSKHHEKVKEFENNAFQKYKKEFSYEVLQNGYKKYYMELNTK